MRAGKPVSAALVTLLAIACGSSSTATFNDGTGGDGGSSGSSGSSSGQLGLDGGGGDAPFHGGPCTLDTECGVGGVCDPSTHACACGGVSVAANEVPPNMLVVEDRSCSMTDKVGATTKWAIAVQAIENLTTKFTGKIRFGLTLFPDRTGNQCTQDAIPIPVAPGNETKIQKLLTAALVKGDPGFPDGPCVTNIDTAMQQALTEPAFNDKARASFAVLITDGMQAGCGTVPAGNAATLAAITSLSQKGVGTFVIGFGSAVDTAALDSFAVAGGHPSTGAHKYYQADDQATLDTILGNLAASALGCDLQLASPPPGGDASLIFVYFNKTPPPVPRDTTHKNGWDYDPNGNVLHFYGAACDQLKTGKVQDARAVFGCPGGPPPPPPK